jgi:hypothetical protein
VFLCAIDSDDRIVDGEWMGYLRSPAATYPFVLQKDGSEVAFAFEGGEEDRSRTSVGRAAMKPGEFFTVFAAVEHQDEEELIFEIVSCHRYE